MNMNKKSLVVALVFALIQVSYSEVNKPNIIFIFADDMGVGDVSHAGGMVPTPHLDKLAAEGVRFTDAHTSSSVCTPSRYSLLTGRYNWRTRLPMGVFNNPHYLPLIEPEEPTVASILKDNGYNTAIVGKWHLGIKWAYLDEVRKPKGAKGHGWTLDLSKPAEITPTSHGFDYFWGIAASLDMPPYLYIEDEKALYTELVNQDGFRARKGVMDVNFKANEVLKHFSEKSVAYINSQAKEEKPFFLYLSLTSPHTPIVPADKWLGKSGLNAYGDFLMETDWVVGEVLKSLEENKISENTLVIFSTDNGCSPAARISELVEMGHIPGGPLRGTKADIYEGGHRVPFIARWPEVIPANSETSRLTSLTDFTATCAEIVGHQLAPHEAVDSVSFLPSLRAPGAQERDAIVHHSINGSFAIRQGDWKLILCSGSGGWSAPKPGESAPGAPPVQLYNLNEDLAETTNLAKTHPEKVKELTALLSHYVAQGRSTPGAMQKNAREIDLSPNPVLKGIEK